MTESDDMHASISRLRGDVEFDYDSQQKQPVIVWVAPPNQVQLSAQEKYEDVQRTLRWNDPNVASNEVKFLYQKHAHKRFPPQPEEHLAMHFSMDGCCLFEDSDEAKAQRLRRKKGAAEDFLENNDIDIAASLDAAAENGRASGSAAAIIAAAEASKNEFNFADRACQTPTVPVREIGITTIPPAVERFSTTVTQWKIYDFFVKGVLQERRESELLALAQESGSSSSSAAGIGSGTTQRGTAVKHRPITASRRPKSRSKSTGAGGVHEAAALRRSRSQRLDEGQGTVSESGDDDGGEGLDLAAPVTRAEQNAKDLSREELLRSGEMLSALHVLERIVNQNREDDIYQDFKYWEDDSDRFKEAGEGSLLPLWRFTSDRTKHTHVTCISWHPTYHDLFAVAYGSYDFTRQSEGLVYCYSLKNTSYPQFMFQLECGAMCLDWHPQHHALLCVGCYDGTVVVFDVRLSAQVPIFKSTVRTGKHTDPVWEVHWQEEDISKGLNFFSVSSDGLVSNWTLSNTDLRMETLMRLEKVDGLVTDRAEAPAASPSSGMVSTQVTETSSSESQRQSGSKREKIVPSIQGLEAGVCVDFNKHSDHLFIVGTEEGHIHKCSKAYSGQYLQSFAGHDMTVYSLQWNPFHPQVFISCSCDWTVKIWRHDLSEPQLTLSLGDTVGDVQWAPYSSTVFAAITNDGFVHVYDLSVNRHEPICKQKVVKRAKLTKLRFSSFDPILLIGDENGAITSMKLSPNLRKNMTESAVYDSAVEKQRLDACLRIGMLLAS